MAYNQLSGKSQIWIIQLYAKWHQPFVQMHDAHFCAFGSFAEMIIGNLDHSPVMLNGL